MAARTIQINSFCGGSSKLADSEFLGMEESLNMYPETVTATDTYSTKILKSVEGFTFGKVYQRSERFSGIGVVNSNPFTNIPDKETALVITYDVDQPENKFCTNMRRDGSIFVVGRFVTAKRRGESIVSEMPNGLALVLSCGELFAVDPAFNGSPTPVVPQITLPDAFDHEGKIEPTQIAQLNFRVILNDKDRDYIYWSEINRPQDSNDVHAFEQNLTQYAYTKNDGTAVTFDDNIFYPPAEGSYIAGTLTTQQVYTSSLNSMKMDFKADTVVALKASDSSLFVFGQNSLEILRWQNSTIAPFAIVHKTSLCGVSFERAVTIVGNECFFVGKGPGGMLGVWAVDENGAVRKISSNAVDQRLQKYTRGINYIKNIESYEYSYKGHQFFLFNIYEGNGKFEETLCYDIVEQVWTDRASFDENDNRYVWNVLDCLSVEGAPLFVTKTNTKKIRICEFEGSDYDPVYGNTDHFIDDPEYVHYIHRERTTGIKYDGINDIVVTSLELVLNNGTTKALNPDAIAYNPKVMLQVSVDGGMTWSNELWAYAGKVGQYSWRTRWNALGKGARFAFRVRMTDPVAFEIATAYLSYLPCGNRV